MALWILLFVENTSYSSESPILDPFKKSKCFADLVYLGSGQIWTSPTLLSVKTLDWCTATGQHTRGYRQVPSSVSQVQGFAADLKARSRSKQQINSLWLSAASHAFADVLTHEPKSPQPGLGVMIIAKQVPLRTSHSRDCSSSSRQFLKGSLFNQRTSFTVSRNYFLQEIKA